MHSQNLNPAMYIYIYIYFSSHFTIYFHRAIVMQIQCVQSIYISLYIVFLCSLKLHFTKLIDSV